MDQPSKRAHAYFARVQYYRTKDGNYRPRYSAYFGDQTYGGKENALKAAIKWVRQHLKEPLKKKKRPAERRKPR